MPRRKVRIKRKGEIVNEFVIDRSVVSIGRHRTNSIVLDDPDLSRYHAALMLDDDGNTYLQDVGSKNGTFIAQQRVSRQRLKSDDEFTLGAYVCSFTEDDGSDPSFTPSHDDVPTQTIAQAELDEMGNEPFIGSSETAAQLLKLVRKIARTNVNALITGESGSGKGVVGKLLHAWSSRAAHPFVPVNCAAIPGELIESELFGHRKGSFTGASGDKIGKFQAADGGTLLLDEIGDMSLAAQAKILRALEEQHIEQIGNPLPIKVDVRVIAATHQDLELAIKEGKFRQDLYFRIATLTLHVPPLRARPDDVVMLAHRFLSQLMDEMPSAKGSEFSTAALDLLRAHRWPGNVRELRNVVARAVVMKEQAVILPSDLGLDPSGSRPRPSSINELMALHIREALDLNDWNISATARSLKISRRTLRLRIERYGIQKPD